VLAVDWPTIFNAAAAVGTIIAAVIAALALRSSAQTARIAELQLAAQTRPLLIGVASSGYLEQDEEMIFPDGVAQKNPVDAAVIVAAQETRCVFSFQLRNVGSGLARITDAFLRLALPDESGNIPPCSGSRPTHRWTFDDVAPGECTRLLVSFDVREDAWKPFRECVMRSESFRVDVSYEDQSGEQAQVALVTLSPKPHETSWYVERVDHAPSQQRGR
jgi:hypothetical protein